MDSFSEALDRLTVEGSLYEKLEDGTVRCFACAHRCLISPGRRGVCQMRFNRAGVLQVPSGYTAGMAVDPVEKKPFFHVYPGSDALTFGMLGCNFHCAFCQNWISSQTLRDNQAGLPLTSLQRVRPDQIVELALRSGAELLVSSYNEPLITAEWALQIFSRARAAGLACAFVSNGHATPEVLEALHPVLNAIKIDLKSMQAENYRALGGRLEPVLDTIRRARALGLWVEVVTLVIPGFNDSPAELWEAARFIVSVSPEIPWHVTAFHPDYRMLDRPYTGSNLLQRAAEIGQEAGLQHVYAGNLPGRVGSLEDTFCPACQTVLVRRRGFTVSEYHLTPGGACPKCGRKAPGLWSEHPENVHLGGWGLPRRV